MTIHITKIEKTKNGWRWVCSCGAVSAPPDYPGRSNANNGAMVHRAIMAIR